MTYIPSNIRTDNAILNIYYKGNNKDRYVGGSLRRNIIKEGLNLSDVYSTIGMNEEEYRQRKITLFNDALKAIYNQNRLRVDAISIANKNAKLARQVEAQRRTWNAYQAEQATAVKGSVLNKLKKSWFKPSYNDVENAKPKVRRRKVKVGYGF